MGYASLKLLELDREDNKGEPQNAGESYQIAGTKLVRIHFYLIPNNEIKLCFRVQQFDSPNYQLTSLFNLLDSFRFARFKKSRTSPKSVYCQKQLR